MLVGVDGCSDFHHNSVLGRVDSDALTPASQRSDAEACAALGRMDTAPTDETSALTPRALNEDSGKPHNHSILHWPWSCANVRNINSR